MSAKAPGRGRMAKEWKKKAKHGAEGPKLNLLQLKGKEIKEITVPFMSS